MSRQVSMSFVCGCGHELDVWVYESVNVTVAPELKNLVFSPMFNVVECPHCGQKSDPNMQFLYHDMDKHFWIYVYPEEMAEHREEIKSELAKEIDQLKKMVPAKFIEDSAIKYSRIFFGKYNLIRFLLEKDSDLKEVNDQYKLFYNGINLFEHEEFKGAISLWYKAIKTAPSDPMIVAQSYFNIACAECKNGKMEEVVLLLEKAIENGIEPDLIRYDPDIAEFRQDPRYQALEKKL